MQSSLRAPDEEFDADYRVISGSGTAEDPYVIVVWAYEGLALQNAIL